MASNLQDFLMDDQFIRFVLGESLEDETIINNIKQRILMNPQVAKEAIEVLTADDDTISLLTKNECKQIKNKIEKTLF